MSSEFQLPALAGFGEWGPSYVRAKAPVLFNQDANLRASLWYDQEEAKPEQDRREAFLNSIFTKNEQAVLQERLVAYVKDIKDAEAATKRTQFDKTTSRYNAAAKDQYHEPTLSIKPSQVKEIVSIENLWVPRPTYAAPKTKNLLQVCGKLPIFDSNVDKAKFSAQIPLKSEVEVIARKAVTYDEVIHKCVEALKEDKVTCPIVATCDEVLACIMAAPASVNSWDIEVTSIENIIFLDRRDGGNTDKEWVNENATGDDLPSDTVDEDALDSRANLGIESTKVNFAFNTQCATKRFIEEKTEPLKEDSHSRKIVYKYYQYIVNEDLPNEYHLIVRTEVDFAEEGANGSVKPYRAFAVLEYAPPKPTRSYRQDSRVAWADNSSLGAILVDIARKNLGKVARWVAMSMLSEATMKIGFITRKGETSKTHSIGSVYTISPYDCARSINIDSAKMWTSVSVLVESILKSKIEDGGIMRQGGEKQLRIFAGEDSDDEDSDMDEEDEDDSDDEDDDDDEDNE